MQTKCPCGKCEFKFREADLDVRYSFHYWEFSAGVLFNMKYCPHCGAKLNVDGTFESWSKEEEDDN